MELTRETVRYRRVLMQIRTTVASAVMNAGDREYLIKTIDSALAGNVDRNPNNAFPRFHKV